MHRTRSPSLITCDATLPVEPLGGRDSPIPKMPATRLGAARIPAHSQGINADARRGPQRQVARHDWPGGMDA